MADDMADTEAPTKAKGKGSGISKVYAGLPLWAWVGIGVVAFLLLRSKFSSGTSSSSTANTPTNNANGTQGAPSIFFLPNGAQQPQGVSVNVNPRGGNQPDYFNAQGQDLGQYRYGQDQLTYLQQNIGNFGLTQAEVTDVDNAYAQISQKYGQATANSLHYSWIGPGNVQGLPRQPATSGQSYNGLP